MAGRRRFLCKHTKEGIHPETTWRAALQGFSAPRTQKFASILRDEQLARLTLTWRREPGQGHSGTGAEMSEVWIIKVRG